jgi:uncharacterized protein YbjT (DUF2867 family)
MAIRHTADSCRKHTGAHVASLLILGANGLVGSHVLDLALADGRVTRVIAPTRRHFMDHPKLLNPVVDLGKGLPEADWWAVDGVVCALGTTRKTAGSDEAFRAVDFDIPFAVAKKTLQHGAGRFALTSSIGANAASRLLYTRTKGELENALRGLGFPSLTILRPGVLGGERGEFRLGERMALTALGVVGPLLPRRYRISPAEVVARTLLEQVLTAPPGERIIEADRLCA